MTLDLEKLTKEERKWFYEFQEDFIGQVIENFSKPLSREAKERLTGSLSSLYEEYRKAGFLIEEEKPDFEIEVKETGDEHVYNITFIPKNKAAAQVMRAYNNV